MISIRKDCKIICDFDFCKVRSIVVVADDMETVQWHLWVHEGTMRMIVQVSFDAVGVVVSNSG